MNNILKIDEKLDAFFGEMYPDSKFFFTTSATAALDLACLGLGLLPGDEVIMPTYTYVGVAQAFVKNGIKVVLIDSEVKTMNIDVEQVEKAITKNTKALIVMHYGGVSCDLAKAQSICAEHKLFLIEDNAQGIFAKYKNNYLGGFGDVACISFENSKNVSIGEGGVLIVKNELADRVYTYYNVGTNKHLYEQGEVDFYQWKSKGFKYYMSNILKEILYEKLLAFDKKERLIKWNVLFTELSKKEFPIKMIRLENKNLHNAHLFWVRFERETTANSFIKFSVKLDLNCMNHYYPLHLSAFSQSNEKEVDIRFAIENTLYKGLVRIPFMDKHVVEIIKVFESFFEKEKFT